MDFEVWAQTDVGLKREGNEDSILVDERLGLFVVADGMGGHEGGEVASHLAVMTAQELVQNSVQFGKITPENLIKKIFQISSERIYRKGRSNNDALKGMGTTMVLGLLYKGKLYIGNVGDSRCYLFRDDKLWRLTADHSLVHEQVRAGLIREEDAESVAGKNVITRSVGFEESVDADVIVREVQSGEIYLLCSDGLSGLVPDDQLSTLLSKTKPQKWVSKSISMAKKAGGDDNISVIIIKIK